MNKKNVGAVIAVASIAGALGMNIYSKYKLLKGEDKVDKDSNVSDEELDNFDVEEMFGEQAEVEEETDKEEKKEKPEIDMVDEKNIDDLYETEEDEDEEPVILNEQLKESLEETKENEVEVKQDTLKVALEIVNELGKTIEEEEVIVKKDEDLVQQDENPFDESMSKYKDMDVEHPDFWKDFDNEIDEEEK